MRYRPASHNLRRDSSRSRSLKLSSRAVARPTGVSPMIRPWSKRKCSHHWSVLGLNTGTSCRLCGSNEAMFGSLARLHWAHASARFSRIAAPPCCSAMTWSGSCSKKTPSSGIRQYSQHSPARTRTAVRRAVEICWRLMKRQNSEAILPP